MAGCSMVGCSMGRNATRQDAAEIGWGTSVAPGSTAGDPNKTNMKNSPGERQIAEPCRAAFFVFDKISVDQELLLERDPFDVL